jgi:hypothetical protein
MITVSLSALIAGARLRADMQDVGWLTDANGMDLVRSAWEQLYVAVASTEWGAHRWTTSNQGTTVPGVDSYDLPSDCWRIEGVDLKYNNVWRKLRKRAWHERNDWASGASGLPVTFMAPIVYDIVADKLVFSPIPIAAVQYKIWYTPDPTPITALDNGLSLEPAWRQWIELHVGAASLRREESYEQAAALQGAADDLWRTIVAGNTRDIGDPDHVRDVLDIDL